jgi:hypothetical protein
MIRPMKHVLAMLSFSVASFLALPAQAWTPPAVGQACKGLRGSGPEVQAISGNYLGGRAIRDGVVDWKSFQSCFRSAAVCETWLSHKALRYPLAPGFARCTPVVLR